MCLIEFLNIGNCIFYNWIGLVEVFLGIINEFVIKVFFNEVILNYMDLKDVNFFVLILLR